MTIFFRSLLFFLLTLTLAIFLSPSFIPRLRQISSHLLVLNRPLTTMASPSYASELKIAELAVQRAAILTKRVFHEKAKGTVDKNDKSPVTIGDFGAQALIIAALRHSFPH